MAADDAATERERVERELNRLELAARWADELAHEIKNPFHAMVINLELVKRRAGDPEGLRERAEVVESELHRVHDLVDSLLRLLRPWPDAASTDVDTVFKALLPAFRARAALHHVHYSHESDGGRVDVPPADLALVLVNLVDNAFDAVGKDGSMGTRVAGTDDAIRIDVSDDGPGLGPTPGEAVERNFTTRAGRAGRGLAVSRDLVDRAGGTLAILPGPDAAGTTIAVTLPRSGRPGGGA